MFIKAINLRKRFDGANILNKVSFIIGNEEKVGLIGDNGAGKTTLLKVLAGIEASTSGRVVKDPQNATTNYLQQVVADDKMTVKEFIILSIPLLAAIKKHLDKSFTVEMLEKYENAGGYTIEKSIPKVLKELALMHCTEDTHVSTLSGGERTRLQLVPILITKPNILLLDEPTNHLDRSGVEFLESYIRSYKGIVITATHDRHFLSHSTTRIIEIQDGSIMDIHGTYNIFLHEKELALQHKADRYKRQERELKKLHDNLELFETASFRAEHKLGKKPKDKDKMGTNFLTEKAARKFARRADIIHRKIENYEYNEKPQEAWKMKLNLDPLHTVKLAFSLEHVFMSYTGMTVLHNFSDMYFTNEKVCFTGNNGSGKTTVLKILAGILTPDSGNVYRNDSIKVGYLSQDHMEINGEKTILADFLDDLHAEVSEARTYLHLFLFTQDDVQRKIQTYSQGEKAKYAFAKLLFHKPQMLILDEPTNYMDITSREVIEKALQLYKGGIITATHDQVLIDAINPTRIVNMHNLIPHV